MSLPSSARARIRRALLREGFMRVHASQDHDPGDYVETWRHDYHGTLVERAVHLDEVILDWGTRAEEPDPNRLDPKPVSTQGHSVAMTTVVARPWTQQERPLLSISIVGHEPETFDLANAQALLRYLEGWVGQMEESARAGR